MKKEYALTIEEYKKKKELETHDFLIGLFLGLGAFLVHAGIGAHIVSEQIGIKIVYAIESVAIGSSLVLAMLFIAVYSNNRRQKNPTYLSLKRKKLEEMERIYDARIKE